MVNAKARSRPPTHALRTVTVRGAPETAPSATT
jgi:hypothetical protein